MLPPGIKPKSQAPDATVLNSAAQPLNLSSLWQEGPAVLVFYHLSFTSG